MPTTDHSRKATARVEPDLTQDHAVITFVWTEDDTTTRNPQVDSVQVFRVQARHSIAEAISLLKKWYAKDPIEPILSFEDAVRDAKPPPSTNCPLHSCIVDTGSENAHTLVRRKEN